MKFTDPLTPGHIIKRYKRFLADVKLDDGQIITAHTPNTGSMKSCWEPNDPVLMAHSDNAKRKYAHTLQMIQRDGSWVGINTHFANNLVQEAIENKVIKELKSYKNFKREVKVGKSRIDFFLDQSSKHPDCYLEVKNVTLREDDGLAYFPDAVSERGTKHLNELIHLKKDGFRTIIFYLVQREDVKAFSPAQHIDEKYAKTLKEAKKKGVEILVYQCHLDPQEIRVSHPLKCILQ